MARRLRGCGHERDNLQWEASIRAQELSAHGPQGRVSWELGFFAHGSCTSKRPTYDPHRWKLPWPAGEAGQQSPHATRRFGMSRLSAVVFPDEVCSGLP